MHHRCRLSFPTRRSSDLPESVYVIFGSKRDLLRSVIESAAAGGRAGVVTEDWLDAIRAEPNQRRRLDLMAEATRDVLGRVADRKSTRLNSSHMSTSYAVF